MNEEKAKPGEKMEKKAEVKSEKAAKLAVIMIRGPTKIDAGKKDTLQMLKLYRKNYCIVVGKSPSVDGMIKKVSEYVTWGEIDASTLKELIEKRGEKTKADGKEQLKPFFRLNSPRGGFERKGIKTPFKIGGALGYRGEKINGLIRRML